MREPDTVRPSKSPAARAEPKRSPAGPGQLDCSFASAEIPDDVPRKTYACPRPVLEPGAPTIRSARLPISGSKFLASTVNPKRSPDVTELPDNAAAVSIAPG